MSERRPVVLVHGAWCTAAAWGEVPVLLRALGHPVEVPDLPGRGGDATPLAEVTLDLAAGRVAALLRQGPPALLVGHSLGGMVIAAAAERAPEHVHRLAFLCAFLPRDGDSVASLMVRQPDTIRPAIRRDAPGSTRLDPGQALPLLAQDADAAAQRVLAAGLVAESNRLQTDPARLTPAGFGRLPRAYLLCEADRTITPDLQRDMLAASPCDPVLTLPADHFPQLSMPDRLARHLADLATL
ncbi:alpha/beta fold hydrolase [Frigidibacter oleivorans]|uniref:alpha/beta fold hydrolase n=1 Tax=Frigidibacter oleivorans TaxID=2487129 RepID=UPI000F8D527B|nr:alpha/beta hydrolase [Frigidibacter oleivorans]